MSKMSQASRTSEGPSGPLGQGQLWQSPGLADVQISTTWFEPRFEASTWIWRHLAHIDLAVLNIKVHPQEIEPGCDDGGGLKHLFEAIRPSDFVGYGNPVAMTAWRTNLWCRSGLVVLTETI